MTNLQKARLYAISGAILGGLGAGYALWCGSRWTVAYTSFVWGSTVTHLWLGRRAIWRERDPEPPELNT